MAQFTNQAQLLYTDAIGALVANSNQARGEVLSGLQISKRALQETYWLGETLVYAVTLVNNGSSAISGLSVTDQLGAYVLAGNTVYPLTYVASSVLAFVNGVLQPSPTVATTQPLRVTGLSIPAGGTLMLLYGATVNENAPLSAGSEIVNTVTADTFCGDAATASATVAVRESTTLMISKSILPTSILCGDTVTYTFVILNGGNQPATAADAVQVQDLFQPILQNIRVWTDGADWTQPAQYSYDETTGAFLTVAGQLVVPAATFEQDASGAWSTVPGSITLHVSGTIS